MTDQHTRFSDIALEFFIRPERMGEYLLVPLEVPENVESLALAYDYPTHSHPTQSLAEGTFTARVRENTIDLGLVAPDGRQVGASGADKREIFISATQATPGYGATDLVPGTWHILAGAYRVAPEGVLVRYQARFTYKQPRWLLGDAHTHTIGSDGKLTAQELAEHARANRLDWLVITDHNQFIREGALPRLPGLTVIPGVEWTHYQGHANFLGLEKPYDAPFFTNSFEETRARFQSAWERGATIVINHPYDEGCPFLYDLDALPFHLLEVWNGPMRPSNLRAIGLWNELLKAGRHVPAIGGSDYHNDRLAQILAGPCVNVLADSDSQADILAALRRGRSYMVFQPESARLEMRSGTAQLGDSTPWSPDSRLDIKLEGLLPGDVLKLITAEGTRELFTSPATGAFEGSFKVEKPGFARVELWQSFGGMLPLLPALVSNPIWFE